MYSTPTRNSNNSNNNNNNQSLLLLSSPTPTYWSPSTSSIDNNNIILDTSIPANKWNFKVACISGAGNGIGREIAYSLRRDYGCHLILIDISETRLIETVNYIEQFLPNHIGQVQLRTTSHVVDVTNRNQLQQLVEDVKRDHGRCEIVLNVAGVTCSHAFDDVSIEEFDRVLNINLGGTINMCKMFMPFLIDSKEAWCINISSMEGLMAFPGNCAYVTSKFAVRGFTESLILDASELHPHIHFSVVCPGIVKTDIVLNSSGFIRDTRIGGEHRLTTPEQVHNLISSAASTTPKQAAKVILSSAIQGKTRILVGSDAYIIDFATRLFPHFWYGFITSKLLIVPSLLLVKIIGKKTLLVLVLIIMRWIWRKYYR
jgi:NAD(P)-dependent dehydrogenase (short-subunit alcohol dehydrogenase family)